MTWLDAVALDTMIVHTTHGEVVKGLKAAVYDDCLIVREAHLLEYPGKPPEDDSVTLLAGDFVIPRERVHYLQRLSNGNGDE